MDHQVRAAVLDRAFAGDGFRLQPAGLLRVRTGRIVAADPLGAERLPFTVEVPVGDHPVAIIDGGGGALVTFADGRPTSWSLALTEGQDVSTLEPGQIFGYPVSCGLGSFADVEAAALLQREWDCFVDIFDELEDRLYDQPGDCVSHVVGTFLPPDSPVTIENPLEYNVMIFPAGAGDDGHYATWVGSDGGRPLCLLTVFDLGLPF